jgi:2-aminobenzoate-CoA ligase
MKDDFVKDRLPPPATWPDFIRDLPELAYPERLNCAVELLDKRVAAGDGRRPCFIGSSETWSYAETLDRVDRIAAVLRAHGVRQGNRVLLRAPNNPMMMASWLAVQKLGAVAVATMPLLRAAELRTVLNRAHVTLAICDHRLDGELADAALDAPSLGTILRFGSGRPGSLEAEMAQTRPLGEAAETAADDIALIAFTSGTTGIPKGCIHAHRDVLAIADTFSAHVLKPRADDIFCGSAPIAFTFGLGASLIFPLRVGAATVLTEAASPESLVQAIERHRATLCFTAPTGYRAMLGVANPGQLASLRRCVSAGEPLSLETRNRFKAATGLDLIDGIGATELLHIFISAADDEIRPGATGKPVPGFRAAILDDQGNELPDGTIGRLAVKGPTGCRYLDDARQADYVQNGWNVTGDAYLRDAEGYYWFQARNDDMIVSAGYNISGPEVEEVLLKHPAVRECAVVAAPDPERGAIAKAFIVLAEGVAGDAALTRALQDFVRAEIAPYKYPRAVAFVAALPRTQTGKLQRFRLREQERVRMVGPG